MKSSTCLIIALWIVFTMIFPGQITAEIREIKDLARDYEPMQLDANYLSDNNFIGAPFEELFAFSYDAATDAWHQIPFQIDERGSDGKYFPPFDYILYEKDEISVMVKDLGDRVSENEWINDPDARLRPRYEILIKDPSTGEKGWFYLYRSSTYSDSVTVDYIDRVNNDIYTDVYQVGHNRNLLMDHLSFPPQRDGTRGTNVIDRQKIRLVGKASYLGLSIDYNKTEDDLINESTYYAEGRIRIIQLINWKIQVSVFGFTYEFEVDLTKRFYRNSAEVVGGQGNIPADMGVRLVRQSIDIHPNFAESKFYNQYNSGLILNRSTPSPVNKAVDIPGVFWALVTKDQGATQGSFMQLISLSEAIGDRQRLYYCSRGSGTDDDDAYGSYGTHDTGDNVSWGDVGLHISGNVQGRLKIASNLFFFRDPVDSAFGAQLAANFGNPMIYDSTLQYIDVTPPAKIVLMLGTASDSSISWSWLAPGDDGKQNGPAALYEMRYATYAPETTDSASLASWWNDANPVDGLPKPTDPLTFEAFEVTGLEREMTYYFLFRSKDDAGNYSEFSNIASKRTTPVELIALDAILEADYVVLNWQTASETNNYGFEVQRKFESEKFEKIGFVKGAGTTNELHSYSFIDTDIGAGEYNYRLKQIDTDGQFVYSNSVQVTIEGPQTFVLHQNYPNPFNSETTLSYEIPTLKQDSQIENRFDVTLKIYNSLGQHIQTLVNERKRSGIYTINWNGRDEFGQIVSSGVYFYQLLVQSVERNNGVWSNVKKMLILP